MRSLLVAKQKVKLQKSVGNCNRNIKKNLDLFEVEPIWLKENDSKCLQSELSFPHG